MNMQETLQQAAHSVSSYFNGCKENDDFIHTNHFKMELQKQLPNMSGQVLIVAAGKRVIGGRI